MENFTRGFEKRAWMELYDLEDAQGGRIIPEHIAPYAEQRLEEEKSKSFALRHPWLTGIPTLGIWPGVAHENASRKILNDVYRKNPEYHQGIIDDRRRSLEARRQHEVAMKEKLIADREAEARERMMATGAMAATSAIDSFLSSKYHRSEGGAYESNPQSR